MEANNIHQVQNNVNREGDLVNAQSCGKNAWKYTKEFCEFTSIQGPAYMVKKVTFLERIWWIFIFGLGMAGSFIMVYQICDKYVTTPVLVSLSTREKSIRDIPFPAVTICPLAKVSNKCLNYTDFLLARKAGKISIDDPEGNVRFDAMALLCKSENHEGTFSVLSKSLNDSVLEELNEAGISLEDMGGFYLEDYSMFLNNCATVDLEKAYCEWMGSKINCQKVMTPLITDQGLCYSFNMYDVRDIYSDSNTMRYFPEGNRRRDWSPDGGYNMEPEKAEELYPRRAFLSGAKNAFVAVFFTHSDDINYACEDFATQGLQVTLHTATRIPRPERVAFTVGLDRLSTAAIVPTFTETSNAIKHFDPWQRFCFFGNERQLKYFKFYSQSNCNFECFINYTVHHCGCVNFYMPRDNNTEICHLNKRFCLEDARHSYTEDILKERLELENEAHGRTAACKCLPLCADLTYNTELSQSEWDWSNPDEVEFDSYNRSELSKYHASGIKVFFKSGFFLPSQRNELYGTTDMISNIGGILSLFVGVSLITSAEIVYFLSFKFMDNYYRYGHWVGAQI